MSVCEKLCLIPQANDDQFDLHLTQECDRAIRYVTAFSANDIFGCSDTGCSVMTQLC